MPEMRSDKYSRVRLLIVPVMLWLSACATHLPMSDRLRLENWQANREKNIKLEKWKLKGRIALSMERQAWTASLQWVQDRQNYQLRIIAPLGQGSIELEGDGHGVTMQIAKDKVLHADAPETLLRKSFGWSVPVSGLKYWVRGIPAPDRRVKKMFLDDAGRISEMQQSGWQVTYSRYSSQGSVELPGKIVLQNGRLKLRLIIRDWVI